MNEKTKQKIIEAIDEGKITDETTLGVFQMVEELNERLDTEIPKITDVIERLKGDKGDSPTKEELLELIEPLIPDVRDGIDADEVAIEARISAKLPDEKKIISVLEKKIPSKEEITKEVLKSIPTKEEIAQEVKIPELQKIDTQEIISKVENDLPTLGNKIRDALELLNGEDRLRIEAINGLQEILDELKSKSGVRVGGGFSYMAMNQHLIDDETPSGTINGVNKDFTIALAPNPTTSLKVYRGGARQRITEDYTLSGNTISFTIAPVVGEVILVDYRA